MLQRWKRTVHFPILQSENKPLDYIHKWTLAVSYDLVCVVTLSLSTIEATLLFIDPIRANTADCHGRH